jgi:hypothetical protein
MRREGTQCNIKVPYECHWTTYSTCLHFSDSKNEPQTQAETDHEQQLFFFVLLIEFVQHVHPTPDGQSSHKDLQVFTAAHPKQSSASFKGRKISNHKCMIRGLKFVPSLDTIL